MAEPQGTLHTSRTHRSNIIPFCVILGVISTPIICARLWTRGVILKKFALEDGLIGIAMVLNVILLVFIGLAVESFGYDGHTGELSTTQRVHALQWLFVGDLFYVVTVGLTKVAILLFYRRLASDSAGLFKYAVYGMIVEVSIYKIIYFFLAIFTCHPIQARWFKIDASWTTMHHYTCINEGVNIFIFSLISALEDLVLAFLPTLIIRRMQIPKRQKIALWCIFGISSLTAVLGFLRTFFIYRTFFETRDWIWEVYWAWIFSGAEMTIGLMCASVPVLKPFYRRYLKRGDDAAIPPGDRSGASGPKDSGIGMYSWLKKARREAIYKRRPGPQSLLQADNSIFDGTTMYDGTAGAVDDLRPRISKTQSWATWTPSRVSGDDCEAGSADYFKSPRKKNVVKINEEDDITGGDRMFINVCSDLDVVEVADDDIDLEHDWESTKRCTTSNQANG